MKSGKCKYGNINISEVTAPTTLLNAGEALEVTCIFTTPPTGTEADINWLVYNILLKLFDQNLLSRVTVYNLTIAKRNFIFLATIIY